MKAAGRQSLRSPLPKPFERYLGKTSIMQNVSDLAEEAQVAYHVVLEAGVEEAKR